MKGILPELHAEIEVRKAGYQWKADKADPLGRLVYADGGDLTTPAEDHFRSYNPFEDESALYRIFAELGPIESVDTRDRKARQRSQAELGEAILGFVNRYGLPAGNSLVEGWSEPTSGQNIARLIIEMRLALALADAIRAKDKAAIAKIASRDGDRGWVVTYLGYEFAPVGKVEAAYLRVIRSASKRLPKSNDEYVLAMEILEYMIGQRVDARLEFFRGQPQGMLGLRTRVNGLLAAMWLQLAMAVIEEKECRRCEHCSKPFEVQQKYRGRHARGDKRFCSDSCRVLAYHHRKILARQLRAEGKASGDREGGRVGPGDGEEVVGAG